MIIFFIVKVKSLVLIKGSYSFPKKDVGSWT